MCRKGRDGITTCRYRYREKYCAHHSVDARECVGEDSCLVLFPEKRGSNHRAECSKEQWFGLYCSKYQRFYCSGKDHCSSVESYMDHLTNFRQSQWGN